MAVDFKKESFDGLVKIASNKTYADGAITEATRRLYNNITTLNKSIRRLDTNTTKYSNALIFLTAAFGLVAVFQFLIMLSS